MISQFSPVRFSSVAFAVHHVLGSALSQSRRDDGDSPTISSYGFICPPLNIVRVGPGHSISEKEMVEVNPLHVQSLLRVNKMLEAMWKGHGRCRAIDAPELIREKAGRAARERGLHCFSVLRPTFSLLTLSCTC